MASIPNEIESKIRQYAADTHVAEQSHMEIDVSQDLETRLDQTISGLQAQLARQKADLELLRAKVSLPVATTPSQDPRKKLQQLEELTAAYNKLADDEPSLPPKGSSIPALLATRLVQDTVRSTASGIDIVEAQLLETKQDLKTWTAELDDARALKTALQERLARLKQQHEERSDKTLTQTARETLQGKRQKTQDYERETELLHRAFNDFIDSHLAAMLAAEELGGPVAGEMMDVDDQDLAVGFSSQGKLRKGKSISDQGRQRRIDDIWGDVLGHESSERLNEKDAAAAAFRDLFRKLYEALLDVNSSGPYIPMERESAAARFLVRAKIAQYHPKDAGRMRLIDFGKELDENV
ncbi:hypothetical protein EJ05DRAFT_382770 [Pseudovirgaria hyperparasitica]|uniref:Centromere protein Cenp-K n=1 Tax=Pseudovirgaria hyperparasitica TaxID=470096 RepID=A0A6A6W5R1_9PEZI|nr:uncharacterized protein EJ05DRAFT_382770 [Pseudovirgaria hyperparasitica]KAF2758268.1 hypothetical protein EJ05DRAFT_382770 [Pseudovirgaria hyperparasitica]